MKALSIRQPWVWAIFHAGKRIENRSDKRGMPPMCKHRGELWIHSACHNVGRYWDDATTWMRCRGLGPPPCYGSDVAPWGAIIGRVQVIDHIYPPAPGFWAKDIAARKTAKFWQEQRDAIAAECRRRGHGDVDMRWWTGDYGLVLSDPQPLAEPVPWRKGRLGIWTMSDELAEQVRAQEIAP